MGSKIHGKRCETENVVREDGRNFGGVGANGQDAQYLYSETVYSSLIDQSVVSALAVGFHEAEVGACRSHFKGTSLKATECKGKQLVTAF